MRTFLINLGQLAAALAAIAAVASALTLASKRPWRFLKTLYDDFKMSIVDLAVVTADVAAMRSELTANGGASLKDIVSQTHRTVHMLEGRQFVEAARTNLLIDELTSPRFECEPNGQVARVNSAFVRAFGYQPEMMSGEGYVSLLTDSDRERFMTAWTRAVHDRRQFRTETSWVTQAGTLLHVYVVIEPSFDERTRKVIRWFGRVEVRGAE